MTTPKTPKRDDPLPDVVWEREIPEADMAELRDELRRSIRDAERELPLTQVEAAILLGLTKERIRQIERDAIQKLRTGLSEYGMMGIPPVMSEDGF